MNHLTPGFCFGILAVSATLTLLGGCSADTSGAASGGAQAFSCVEPGTYRETITPRAGDPLCPTESETKTYPERGSDGIAQAECKSGCTCTGKLEGAPTCGGSFKEVCGDSDDETTYEYDVKRGSSTRFQGTVKVTRKSSKLNLSCTYDWTYERIGALTQ
jgi:hypothetical protein